MKAIAGNVFTKLLDLTDDDRLLLDRNFAIKDQGLWHVPQLKRLIMSGRLDDRVHFFNKKTDIIPTGLLLKVQALFPNIEIERQITPEQWTNWERAKEAAKTVEVNGITLRDDQRPAVVSAVEFMRGIVKGCTNFGKTPVGAAMVKAINVPTLWVIHRKPLLTQTAKELEDFLGIPVGRIGDGHKTTGSLLTVGIDKSILNRGAKWLEQFECVIFDEAQHLSCKTQQTIAEGCINAPWRFAMSGSFPKDKLKVFRAMAAADAALLCEVKNSELIEKGVSARPIVHIRPLRYPALVNGRPLYGFEYNEAQEYCIYDNEFFACMVAADAEKWVNQDQTVLIFAGRCDQGLKIQQKLLDKSIKTAFIDYKTPNFVREEALRKFGNKEIAVLVSVMTLTEGINCPSMGSIIMASGKKSDGETLQKIGRLLRKKKTGENVGYVQEYNFIGSKYTEKHSQIRRNTYKKEGFQIVDEQEYNLG
jgi:superfamily II DNA or RNA helicase